MNLNFSPDSDEVGDNAVLTVSFTLGNDIGNDGLVYIEFPLWNPNRQFSSQEKHYFEGSVSCSSSTNINADVSCSYSESTRTLTVDNGIPGGLVGGTNVQFLVDGFTNPISGALVTGFTIYTANSDGDYIDTATTTLQVSTATDFESSSFTVASSVSDDISGVV